MTLNNIKQMKKQKGFTIVELLIVIVIIGILAALVIVAYNGIQNRAKAAAGQNLANVLVKKAEAFNSINSAYPTYCQLLTNTLVPTGAGQDGVAGLGGTTPCVAGGATAGAESKVDNVNTVAKATTNTGGSYTATLSNGNAVVGYFSCAAGADVYYWDYSATVPAVATSRAGAGC